MNKEKCHPTCEDRDVIATCAACYIDLCISCLHVISTQQGLFNLNQRALCEKHFNGIWVEIEDYIKTKQQEVK